MPALAVEPAPPSEKGSPPAICPQCRGDLTGGYMAKAEEVIDQWEEQCRPRKSKRAHQQLRRTPYRYRWLPRETHEYGTHGEVSSI